MSIDSRLKRASVVSVGFQAVAPSVQPDGTLDATDRVVIAYNYAIEVEAILPPNVDVLEVIGRVPVVASAVAKARTAVATVVARVRVLGNHEGRI